MLAGIHRFLLIAGCLSFACHAKKCTPETRPYISGPASTPLGRPGDTFSVQLQDPASAIGFDTAECSWFLDGEDRLEVRPFAIYTDAVLDIDNGRVNCTVPSMSNLVNASIGKVRVTVQVYSDEGAGIEPDCMSHGGATPKLPGIGWFTFFWYDTGQIDLSCKRETQPYLETMSSDSLRVGDKFTVQGKWVVHPSLHVSCAFRYNGLFFSQTNPVVDTMNYDTGEVTCIVPTPRPGMVPSIYGESVWVSVNVKPDVKSTSNYCISHGGSGAVFPGSFLEFTLIEPLPTEAPTKAPTRNPTQFPTRRPSADGAEEGGAEEGADGGDGNAANTPCQSSAAAVSALSLFISTMMRSTR